MRETAQLDETEIQGEDQRRQDQPADDERKAGAADRHRIEDGAGHRVGVRLHRGADARVEAVALGAGGTVGQQQGGAEADAARQDRGGLGGHVCLLSF
ncbi:hypothetical protein FQZ97_1079300 [compost metagenome]